MALFQDIVATSSALFSAKLFETPHLRRFLVGVLVLVPNAISAATPLPSATPESVGMSAERLEKIGTYFKKEVAEGRIPGGVIAVARSGKLVYFTTFGVQNPATAVPMQTESIFRLYSMTKPLTSVAAMVLVEDGAIRLGAPISKYLPEFSKMQVSVAKKDVEGKTTYEMVPAENAITVQDLLRHTSGLTYGHFTTNAPVKQAYAQAGVHKPEVLANDYRILPAAEQISALAKAPLAYQPGTTWEYGLSTDILGRVIEAVSGKRLGDFLEERLLKPLKMVDTGFSVSAAAAHRLAEPFETDPFTKRKFPLFNVSTTPNNDSGGAGAVSTAGDYLRFTQMLLNGGSLDGVRVISPATIRFMVTDQLGDRKFGPGASDDWAEGYSFGLGFLVRQKVGLAEIPASVGTFAWSGAGGTYFWADPQEQLTAVLMLQVPGPAGWSYWTTMGNLTYQAIVK